ncbi:MAG: O-antigen ligase family protein [Polyangiaceae bacterium]
MFAVFGLIGLIVFIYLKPQEFIPVLGKLPFLYLFLALTVFGLALDLRGKHIRLAKGPHLPYMIGFFVWCMITGFAKTGGAGFTGSITQLAIALTLYVLVSTTVQTFKVYETVVVTLIAVSLFVGFVGFHQGLSPMGCAVQEGRAENLRPDGRPCQVPNDCYLGDAEPGADYQCERQGLFGTMSVGGGRVRYRGVLRDPNELALSTSVAIPLLIGRVQRKPSISRVLLFIVATVMIAVTLIFTQSRGGQLVFLATFGAYFIKRFGAKGLAIGALVAMPVLLLGGRDTGEAAGSTTERVEIMVEGLEMFRANPLLGVGYDQFTQHHFLTAHNSYLLPLAETGPIGLYLFAAIMYLSVKIPLRVLSTYRDSPEASVARGWAMSLLAGFAGFVIGIFFLSFTYHHILWIYFGLAGGLYQAVRTHDPDFKVELTFWEYVALAVASVGFIAFLFVYTKIKLG